MLDRVLHGNLPIRSPEEVLAERQRRLLVHNIQTTTLPPRVAPVTLRQSLPFWLAFASVVWVALVALYLILYYAL